MDKVLLSSESDEWFTPPTFFRSCEEEVGGFDLDPCATHDNHKAPRYFTQEDDGLFQEWHGKVFVNPPYSENNKAKRNGKTVLGWIEKCSIEIARGGYRLYICSYLQGQIPKHSTSLYTINREWRYVS